jgi:hypothetical protein
MIDWIITDPVSTIGLRILNVIAYDYTNTAAFNATNTKASIA